MKTWIILILFFFAGCDLFNTRDAETPNQPRSNFIPPIEPEDVISNLTNSLKDMSVENYLACFADTSYSNQDFRFTPSSTALSQFPVMGQGWGKKEEQQYFINLKNKITDDKQITLNLSETQLSSPQGDSVAFTATYSLSVPHNDPDIPLVYEGKLNFSLIRDSRSLWSIYFWRDANTSELPAWSELKGRFY